MSDLLPCPFCGGAPLLDQACLVRDTHWWVRCHNIDICKVLPHGMQCVKQSDAIAAWNTRATGWQDMATAPEETEVLIWSPKYTYGPYVGVLNRAGDWYAPWDGSGWSWPPTHWQPLPKPPEE